MIRLALSLLLLLAVGAPASADHASVYEEDRSRPGEATYRFQPALCSVSVRSVPADPLPGVPASLEIEIRPLDPGSRFEGDVHVSVVRDVTWGSDPVVWGPETVAARDGRSRFRPRFAEAGAHRVCVEYLLDGQPSSLEFHAVAGPRPIPWGRLAFALLVVLGFAGLSRRRLLSLRDRGGPGG